MNPAVKRAVGGVLKGLYGFFSVTVNRRFFYLVVIALIALGEWFFSGLVRRTFVFYTALEGKMTVESRMIRRASDPETAVRRYVDEVLLGPVSPDLDPLFPKETRLAALLVRDGTVYADFSEDAALPVEGSLTGEVFGSFLTLNEGIRRNFPGVKNAALFIGGKEIFFNEFSVIFADPADNTDKTSQKALTN